jgi:hypothetical protein
MVPQALAMSSLRHPSAFILTPQSHQLIRHQRDQHIFDGPYWICHSHHSTGLFTKKRPQFTARRTFVKFVRLGHNYLTACGVVPSSRIILQIRRHSLIPFLPQIGRLFDLWFDRPVDHDREIENENR